MGKGNLLPVYVVRQESVVAACAFIFGKSAELTVLILETSATVLPHASVAVQVSVTVPPHAPGVAVKVERFDVPLIKHPPDAELLKGNLLPVNVVPHDTVVAAGAVIVGKAAGLTVIILETDAIVLPHASVAV